MTKVEDQKAIDYLRDKVSEHEQTIVKLSTIVANSKPDIRGKWEEKSIGTPPHTTIIFLCSNCMKKSLVSIHNYCPNCGAEMEGVMK